MLRLRLLTALALNVLLIQVNLAGYGPMCVERGSAAGQANTAPAMSHAAGASHGSKRACGDAAADEGCPLPWAPAGCSTLSACVAPALPARVSVAAADTPTGDRLWGDAALVRQGPRPAPDLPPPRA